MNKETRLLKEIAKLDIPMGLDYNASQLNWIIQEARLITGTGIVTMKESLIGGALLGSSEVKSTNTKPGLGKHVVLYLLNWKIFDFRLGSLR